MIQPPQELQPPKEFKWWTSPRTILRHVLMLDDTPHSIALGLAIGMFVALTPTGGIQMLLVLGIAYLCRPFFRFNQVAGLLATYVSNPLTAIPIFWADFRAGAIFFPDEASPHDFATHLGKSSELTWFEQVRWLYDHVGAPFIVGSLVIAVIGGALTYPLTRLVLGAFHWRKRTKRVDEPAKQPAATVRD